MTSPKQETDELVERLRKVESSHSFSGAVHTTNWHRNPDGPEAAARLTALAEEVKWKDAALGGAAMDLNFARREFLREGNKEAAAMMERSYKAVIAALTKDQQQ